MSEDIEVQKPVEPKVEKSRIMPIVSVLGAVILVAGAVIWMAYAVYIQRSDAKIVRTLGSWLPAAQVGPKTIRYGEFLDTRDTIRIYLSSEAAKGAGLAGPLTSEVEKNALDRMIREQITLQLAENRKVTVTDEEVRAAFASLIQQTSSTMPDPAQYLTDTFHWTEDQFRNRVIRPALEEERVAQTYASTTQEQQTAFESIMAERIKSSDVKTYLKF
ncbi:SurA N-terminal domain-containing protein [Patescibacteria group bacterium]|nr:SurA N-terminal domain-containing protein [Patescibacteria group bacterium]